MVDAGMHPLHTEGGGSAAHLFICFGVSLQTHLILVKDLPVMEVRVREYPVDAATHRAQLGHRRLLDAHPVQRERGCPDVCGPLKAARKQQTCPLLAFWGKRSPAGEVLVAVQ